MTEKIEKVLDEKVRPFLKKHGGNVEIVSFQEHILKIRLSGQCSGCPSAQITAQELIGETVKNEIEDVRDVVLVCEINPELTDLARKILSGEMKFSRRQRKQIW